jgi:hypothetical protein
MAGYIGSKASVVSSGAERKKTFTITGATTSLTGLNYTVGKVHVFQNGVRLVDGTDYTATNGTTITLTVAAQSGDNVVVISQAAFQVALSGIDDQSNAVAMTIDSNENIGIGTSNPSKKFVVSEGGAHGFEISPYDGSQNATRLLNYNRSTNAYFPLEIEASQIAFETNGSEKMRITSAGNVGIGVVPESGVSADVTELDLGLLSLSLWKGEGQPNDGASYGYNCYKTGGLTYKAKVSSNSGDFRPAVYEQIYGQHRFKVASSATADSTISFNEAMRIDSSGRVTKPSHPYASASCATVTSASTIIPLNAYNVYNGGMNIDNTNQRFTVPVAGQYVVGFHHLSELVNTQVQIRKNGVAISGLLTQATVSGNGIFSAKSITALAANDYIEFRCANGRIHGNSQYNSMYVYLIG